MHCFYYMGAYYCGFLLWCFIWVDLAHAYTMFDFNKLPQASMIICFWLVIPLYALVNNVLSLCMVMAAIALLVGRSQSFASLHLYWVWALLVHPTPKNQSFLMCPPYLPITSLLFQVHSSCFCLPFKLNFLLCEN
jgi:hypothetical protein